MKLPKLVTQVQVSAADSYEAALASATRQIRAELAHSIFAAHKIIGEEISDEGIELAYLYWFAAHATHDKPLHEAAQEIGMAVVRYLDRMIERRAVRLVEGERK